MNTQLNQLQRLLAEIDSLMASAEVSGLIRDARSCAEKARSAAAKAIKLVAELDAQQNKWPAGESPEERFEHYVQNTIDRAPEPMRRLGQLLSRKLDDDDWKAADGLLIGACFAQVEAATQAALGVQGERRRQIEVEGWTPEHDDQHKPGELARAAAAYLLYAYPRVPFDQTLAVRLWPWVSGFNPKGEQRDLERAGALALAALERMHRAAAPALGDQQ